MSDDPKVMLDYYLAQEREQITKMEAGRELDRMVAKAIKYVSLSNGLNPDGTTGYLPPYSTDIAAAMEALDTIKDNYESAVLVYSNGWQCVLTKFIGTADEDGDFEVKDWSYDSPSLPEAICIACLLALKDADK